MLVVDTTLYTLRIGLYAVGSLSLLFVILIGEPRNTTDPYDSLNDSSENSENANDNPEPTLAKIGAHCIIPFLLTK